MSYNYKKNNNIQGNVLVGMETDKNTTTGMVLFIISQLNLNTLCTNSFQLNQFRNKSVIYTLHISDPRV